VPANNPPEPRAPAPAAKATLAELYCARHHCPPAQFRRRIFWRTLHRHAVPFAPLLLLGDYFKSDRALIDACARTTGMRQVHEETRDQPVHPYHGLWLHRRAKLRISTQRLRRLAASCFAPPGAEPEREGDDSRSSVAVDGTG